jgi:hypothetical protein
MVNLLVEWRVLRIRSPAVTLAWKPLKEGWSAPG